MTWQHGTTLITNVVHLFIIHEHETYGTEGLHDNTAPCSSHISFIGSSYNKHETYGTENQDKASFNRYIHAIMLIINIGNDIIKNNKLRRNKLIKKMMMRRG